METGHFSQLNVALIFHHVYQVSADQYLADTVNLKFSL